MVAEAGTGMGGRQKDRRDPAAVMPKYVAWMKGLCAAHKARPVFVGYPASSTACSCTGI